MLKHQIRKKILKIRDKKYSNSLNIDKKKILKIIQKANIKNPVIGIYYPVNTEVSTKKIMEFLEKKKYPSEVLMYYYGQKKALENYLLFLC